MRLSGYRAIWANRTARTVLLLGMLARVPVFGGSVLLPLHIVERLDPRYSAAGLISAAATVAIAVAGPWRGRLLDRIGLRRTLLPSLLLQPVCWALIPVAGYWTLLLLFVVGGLVTPPIFPLVRQTLTASVPAAEHKTAFALDSVLIEIGFMTGPAAAIWAATVWDTGLALMTFQLAAVAVCCLFFWLNPPIGHRRAHDATRRTRWFTAPVAMILLATACTTFVLGGPDLGVVAALRHMDQPSSIGWVLTVWGAGSAVGGLCYGALHRGISVYAMLFGLGLTTIAVCLASSPWTMAALLFVNGFFVAPTITAGVEALTAQLPEDSRGEALGWHGSMLTGGTALGAPTIGVAIDRFGWAAGFLLAGLVGVVLATSGWLLSVRGRREATQERSGN